MGQQVEDEVRRLTGKTDEDIVTIYGQCILNPFPSTVLLTAVQIIMGQRNIEVGEIYTSISYKNGAGQDNNVILKSKS